VFSYIEQQVLLVGLIEVFRFEIPDGGSNIRRANVGGPVGGPMVPLLRDDPKKGIQMPLQMSLVGT
jgi:hypothetical protein